MPVYVCLLDSVSEAVVHQSRRRPAGVQDTAHAVGRWYWLLTWKGKCHVDKKEVKYWTKYY